MYFIVSYDITEDDRRLKVAKTLKNYGERVQYSVFECQINQEQLASMINSLKKLMNAKEDSIRVYQLCEGCIKKSLSLGEGEIFKEKDVFIV